MTRRAVVEVSDHWDHSSPYGARRVRHTVWRCWGCGRYLASAYPREAFIHVGLVPRPERHEPTGLPRYGPPRRGRQRHGLPRIVAGVEVKGWDGTPVAIGFECYANCPECDRGQRVGPLNSDVLASPLNTDLG